MRAAFLMIAEDKTWQVARSQGDEVALCEPITVEPGDMPAALRLLSDQLRNLGYSGGGVCLGLPSGIVLAASIDVQNIPRKNRRKGMLYRLEEQLPLEAERLTADYMPAVGGKALAVAVETARIQSIIDQLAQGRVEVASICPTALLTLREECADGGGARGSRCDYVAICGDGGMDLFRMVEGTPVAWYSARSVEELARRLEVDLLSRPVESAEIVLRVIGKPTEGLSALREKEPALRIESRSDKPPAQLAAGAAARHLEGRAEGWPELRRDGLAMPDAWKRFSRPLSVAACAMVLFLAAATVALLWRAARYDNLADRSLDRQASLYRRLYPSTAVPEGVASRFRSEYKRLSGVSGESGDIPDSPGVLEALRRLVGNLPPAVRLRIVDVRITPGGITVEGQARSHGEAQAVVQALSKGGLSFEPPRSETVTRGDKSFVSFTLTGKLAPARPTTQVAGGGGEKKP